MTSGLVISRLGVQATASDDLVHGLICLRISLPRENESNHSMRWNLFSGNPPKIISEPSIHPLPIPLPLPTSNTSGPRTTSPRALAIASTLLNLSTPPDSPRTQSGPHLHVAPNGQLSVVLEPRKKRMAQVQGGRSDWVVIMEFEAVVERGSERGLNKVLLSLPKSLHSIIRFQIIPPLSGPSTAGEVSILTEPKMLALPLSTFANPPIPFPRDKCMEEGWEDEDVRSEFSEEDDGSWLEGRFQATNQLRLEWSFIGTSSPTTLNISPSWERKEIHFAYETTLSSTSTSTSTSNLVPIEMIIPDGWGWSHFDIQGQSLRSFRSTDIEAWHTTIFPTSSHHEREEEEEDESFSTIRNIIPPTLRPSMTRSSSLMKQSLPTSDIDEFSFENQDESGTTTIIPSSPEERKVIVPDRPTPARLFDLVFDDDDEHNEDKTFVIEGILVPLFPTLVSGSVAVDLPFVRSQSGECQVTCPCPNSTTAEMCDTSGESIGTFTWVDMYGSPIPSSSIPVRGEVRVRLMRDTWGSIRMSILFPCKRGEVVLNLGKGEVNVRKVEVDGAPIRYFVSSGVMRLGSDVAGMVEIELDLGEGDISLPQFEGAEGTMIIELRGPGWETISIIPGLIPHPNLSQTFSTPLPCPPINLNLNPSIKSKSKSAKTLFSFSTFFNLLLLWLVVSLGQQVQRLRSEMVFVVEEARDLRQYHQPPIHAQPEMTQPSSVSGEILPDGIDLKELLERLRLEQTSPSIQSQNHSLGRVVFNQWEWVNHPAVRTVSLGVSKIWDVVLWLIHGS